MANGLTDQKASVPKWGRSLIVFIHGVNVMDMMDLIGAVHDHNLKGGMDRHAANRLMVGEMASQLAIPAYLTLIFWAALWIYAALPGCIADLYWRLV